MITIAKSSIYKCPKFVHKELGLHYIVLGTLHERFPISTNWARQIGSVALNTTTQMKRMGFEKWMVEDYPSVFEEYREYSSNSERKLAEDRNLETGWTWKTLGFWPIFAQKYPRTLCPTSCGGPELLISKVIGVALFTDFARLRWDPHFQPPCREAFSLVRFTPHSDRPQAPATHHTHSPALAARWRIGRTSRQSFWCNIAGTRYVCLGPRVWREGEWPCRTRCFWGRFLV